MAALIVDPPPASSDGQRPPGDPGAGGPAASGVGPTAAGAEPAGAGITPPVAAAVRSCDKCGTPMALGQDWCLHCGAGTRGSLGSPGWRSASAILAATALLVLAAAGAGYAALSKRTQKPAGTSAISAHTTATTSSVPPAATTPATGTTTVPPALGTPTTIKPAIPLTATKVTNPLPTPSVAKTTIPATTPTPTVTTPAATGGSSSSEETKPAAILLDTNAASTYNPYSYPASIFGDPSLTIDGDTTTGWTAQVNPASAPSMAVGVLIALHAKQKVASLELITSTPGMSVQVYGAVGQTVPSSITDPAWTPLTGYLVIKKRHVRMHLRDATKAFTFVTLWISKAPADAVGTPEAPGHVSVNEIELFPSS